MHAYRNMSHRVNNAHTLLPLCSRILAPQSIILGCEYIFKLSDSGIQCNARGDLDTFQKVFTHLHLNGHCI